MSEIIKQIKDIINNDDYDDNGGKTKTNYILYEDTITNKCKRYGLEYSVELPKGYDELIHSYLVIDLMPLPNGWKWKKDLPLKIIAKAELNLGGQGIYIETPESRKILFYSKQHEKYPDSMFTIDGDTKRIMVPILSDFVIPIFCFGNNSNGGYFNFEVNYPENLVEGITDNPEHLPHTLVSNIEARHIVRFYGEKIKSKLITFDNCRYMHFHNIVTGFIKKGEKYINRNLSEFSKNVDSTCIQIKMNGSSSVVNVYLLVQDEEGNELDKTVIDSIDVYINNIKRYEITDIEMKYHYKNKIKSGRNELLSKNLFFIDYNNGLKNPDNSEKGIEIKDTYNGNYVFYINFKQESPYIRYKISIMQKMCHKYKTLEKDYYQKEKNAFVLDGSIGDLRMCNVPLY